MAFLVEDGTGLALANSYEGVTEFKAYHAERGNDITSDGINPFTDPEIEMALIRASDYLDKRFGARWRGYKQTREQGRDWPRISATDDNDYLYSGTDAVPRNLKKATNEYGLRALRLNPLAPDPQLPFQDRGATVGETSQGGEASGEIKRLKEKIDVLETDTAYETSAAALKATGGMVDKGGGQVPSLYIPTYPEADMLVKQLIFGGAARSLGRS